MVVIEEVDQFAEFQLPGERGRIRRHTLHQISVADQPVSEVVDDLEVRPGDRVNPGPSITQYDRSGGAQAAHKSCLFALAG